MRLATNKSMATMMTEMKNNDQHNSCSTEFAPVTAVPEQNSLTAELSNAKLPIEEAAQENGTGGESAQENGTGAEAAIVIPKPKVNSKLILQNMEEVLNSVKKKHRAKHKRKRELKRLALMKAEKEGTATSAAYAEKRHERKSHHKKKPLRVAQDNLDNVTPNSSTILAHFMRTPKKDEPSEPTEKNEVIELVVEDSLPAVEHNEKPPEPKGKTNAFEVMMNARNKVIGSNAGANETMPPGEVCNGEDNQTPVLNAKRKLLLQNLAERKGAGKRKLEEEARAVYVEQQLEQRAKRLKNMLERHSVTSPSVENASPKTDSKTKSAKKQTKKNAAVMVKTTRNLRSQSADLSTEDAKTEVEVKAVEKDINIEENNSAVEGEENIAGRKRRSSTRLSGRVTKQDEDAKKEPQQTQDEAKADVKINDVGSAPKKRGRPRRSCITEKSSNYNEMSPIKQDNQVVAAAAHQTRRSLKENKVLVTSTPVTSTKKKRGRTAKAKSEGIEQDHDVTELSDEVIDVDDSQTPKKLAPLFTRQVLKPLEHPETLVARREFLRSGVPEKVRLERHRLKQYEQNYEESWQLYPSISHVRQLDDTEVIVKSTSRLALKQEEETQKVAVASQFKQKLFGIRQCRQEQLETIGHSNALEKCRSNVPLSFLTSKRLLVRSWKLQYHRFPTYKCYNQLRGKYRYFSALDTNLDTQQVNESFMVTRVPANLKALTNNSNNSNINGSGIDDDNSQPPATAPNGELLFTEKYKPLLFEQVLVNFTPVVQLRDFLSNWCTSNVRTVDDDSVESAADMSWSNGTSNAVVLLGPHASGKTNAVFALANELNFNVLEINAGMKRTGKRLVQELHEATQSHQIAKEAVGSKKQQKPNLMQMSLANVRKTRASQTASPMASTLNATTSSGSGGGGESIGQRKCLILIEDADIAFEQTDAGFIDAIHTLAAASKRPVIIVASNPNCAHLQRLMSQQTITFNLPHVLSIARYLAILSLIENCPISIDDVVSLYLYNGMDVRRTLLEMQLFVQSGGDMQRKTDDMTPTMRSTFFASPTKSHIQQEQQKSTSKDTYVHQTLFDFYTLDQNNRHRLPYPVDFGLLSNNMSDLLQSSPLFAASCSRPTSTKTCSPKKTWLSSSQVKEDNKLDMWSEAQSALCDFYEHISVASLLEADDKRFRMSQQPNLADSSDLAPSIAADMTHTLVEQAIIVNLCPDSTAYNLFHTEQSQNSLCNHLNVGALRGSRSTFLDWEPALRNICRIEQRRANEDRRSTRFYHYLRNSCSNGINNFSTEHFNNACNVFQNIPQQQKQQGEEEEAEEDQQQQQQQEPHDTEA